MNITENLQRIVQAKNDIKDAIIQKGVQVDDSLTIDNFADKILQIEGSGSVEDNLDKLFLRTITSYNIPNGVNKIISNQFAYCGSLSSITIPDSVTSIGDFAFAYCISLTSITIPDSVTSIGGGTFQDCSGLTSVTIPNSVTSIGDFAFQRCKNLTSITISDSVTSIGDRAFTYCSSLVEIFSKNIVAPTINRSFFEVKTNGVLHVPQGRIGSYSNWMEYLSERNWTIVDDLELKIPERYMKVKYNVASTDEPTKLYNSISFQGVYDENINPITLEGNNYTFEKLGENTIYFDKPNISLSGFVNNTSITEIVFPSTISEIPNSAIRGCTNLTSVIIPNSVTKVGTYFCYNSPNITSVTIPKNVTSIGGNFISNCPSLTSVTFECNIRTYGQTNITTNNNVKVILFNGSKQVSYLSTTSLTTPLKVTRLPYIEHIVVPDDLYNEWIADIYWSNFTDKIIKKSDFDAL